MAQTHIHAHTVSEVSDTFTYSPTPNAKFDVLWTTSCNHNLTVTLCIWHICNNICKRNVMLRGWALAERSAVNMCYSLHLHCVKSVKDLSRILWLFALISWLHWPSLFANNSLSLSDYLTLAYAHITSFVSLTVESQYGGQRATNTVWLTSTRLWYKYLCPPPSISRGTSNCSGLRIYLHESSR